MSVNCQDEEKEEEEGQTKSPEIFPIPDQSQIQLKDKFCFSYSCLANITDPLEGDKVYWLNYWHILISNGTSGFTSNTLLIRFQYITDFLFVDPLSLQSFICHLQVVSHGTIACIYC